MDAYLQEEEEIEVSDSMQDSAAQADMVEELVETLSPDIADFSLETEEDFLEDEDDEDGDEEDEEKEGEEDRDQDEENPDDIAEKEAAIAMAQKEGEKFKTILQRIEKIYSPEQFPVAADTPWADLVNLLALRPKAPDVKLAQEAYRLNARAKSSSSSSSSTPQTPASAKGKEKEIM